MKNKVIAIMTAPSYEESIRNAYAGQRPVVKCENCRHWAVESINQSAINAHTCSAMRLETRYVGRIGFWTEPDFFCSLFEEKESR